MSQPDILASEDQVNALARLNTGLWIFAQQGFNLFGEDASGVDNVAGVHADLLVREVIIYLRAARFLFLGEKSGNFRVIGDDRSILGGGTQQRQGQARVVGLRVVV